MDTSAPPAPGGPAVPKLSTVILLGIAGIGAIVLAAIFGYILVIAVMADHSRLWWMGLVSFVFALIFYLLSAATRDPTVLRPLAGAFFLIGAGGFYGSLFLNPDTQFGKLVWLILLSLVVVGVLVGMLYMARDREKEAARKAQRRVVP